MIRRNRRLPCARRKECRYLAIESLCLVLSSQRNGSGDVSRWAWHASGDSSHLFKCGHSRQTPALKKTGAGIVSRTGRFAASEGTREALIYLPFALSCDRREWLIHRNVL